MLMKEVLGIFLVIILKLIVWTNSFAASLTQPRQISFFKKSYYFFRNKAHVVASVMWDNVAVFMLFLDYIMYCSYLMRSLGIVHLQTKGHGVCLLLLFNMYGKSCDIQMQECPKRFCCCNG
jgi:hypothetical protein